jgi:hypothetical protein
MIKFKDILKESNGQPISKEEIETIWKRVFPNSQISIRPASFGGGIYCKGYLAKDKSELSNGYWENDMLNYSFKITDNRYEESATSIYTRPPQGSNLVYSRAKLRAKSINGINAITLEKRFNDVKRLVISVKDNLPNNLKYDINDKI